MKENARILTEIVLIVFRLKTILLDGGNDLVGPLGTDSTEWQVLGALALAQQSMTAPMVAESMGMTRQGAQKRLNKLAKDRLVTPLANPRHDRSPIWVLTDEGMTFFNSIMQRYDVWIKALLPHMDADRTDFEVTCRVLQQLETVLHQTNITRDVLPNVGGKSPAP